MADDKDNKKSNDQQGAAGGLPARKVTTNQQVLIWFLIIVVGLLFSMTGTGGFFLLGNEQTKPGVFNVPYKAGADRQGVQARLVDANIYDFEYRLMGRQSIQNWQYHCRQIWLADIAGDRGLSPRGDALDALVKDWVSQPAMPWGGPDGETRLQVIEDLVGSARVNRKDLERYLQVEASASNLLDHETATAVVPATVHDAVSGMAGDKLDLHIVKLTTKRFIGDFIDQVTEDQLATAYEQHREQWFKVPAKRTATVIYADPEAIAAQVVIKDDEVQAYYDAPENAGKWFEVKEIAPATEEGGEAKTERVRKPVEAVKGEIISALTTIQSQDLAAQLHAAFMDALANTMREADITSPKDITDADFDALVASVVLKAADHDGKLVADVGLVVHKDQVYSKSEEVDEETAKRTIALPDGRLFNVVDDLWDADDEVGHVLGLAGQAFDNDQLIVRLAALAEASFQPQDEVVEELRTWQAGQLAYAKLIEEGSAVIEAVTAAGGLKAYFEQEANAQEWSTALETVEGQAGQVLAQFYAPAEELDGTPGDAMRFIQLAAPSQPVFLAGAIGDGRSDQTVPVTWFGKDREEIQAAISSRKLVDDLPTVLLAQCAEYVPASTDDRATPDRSQQQYQSMIDTFQRQLIIQRLEELAE